MSNNLHVKDGLNGTVFQTGYEVLKNKGLAIIWMSTGNSYFSPDNIQRIIEFCSERFSVIRILAPFEPAIHTYKSIGYEEKRASRKAKLNSNRLKNHTRKTIEKISNKKIDIKIIDWDADISSNEHYKKILKAIEKLYSENESFQKNADSTTEQVLKNKIKPGKDAQESVKTGVRYLFEELAFVLASPLIFQVKQTAYIYHKRWPILENLVNGKYDKIRKNVGFLLIK